MEKFLVFGFLLAFASGTIAFRVLPDYLQQPSEGGKLWAVLVAGSYTWDNYRHQAAVCHAYQILKNHGVPDEQIIVMMVDDIANNTRNPTPGVIINHPKGKDVYKGVPKDYTGLEGVTPENFMAVLRGDKAAVGSGKVLESGPNDHVFVYFADHGAPGLLFFPESELTARDLNKTINYMHTNKKYGKMVIYIEACRSGSMFENILPDNINVYATTASNSEQPSYACYYDNSRETYLGDMYSLIWQENSDKEVLSKETIREQFKVVKDNTTYYSKAQEFGDLSIANLPVGDFLGKKDSEPIVVEEGDKNPIASRDAHVDSVMNRMLNAKTKEEENELLKKLEDMYKYRYFLTGAVADLVLDIVHDDKIQTDILVNKYKLRNFDCYDEVRKHFDETCFQLSKNEYALDSLYILVNLCEKQYSAEDIKFSMDKTCVWPPVTGIV